MNLYENPDVQRRRTLARLLTERGLNTSYQPNQPYTNAQMVADLLSTGVGAWMGKRADDVERGQRDALNRTLADALRGPAEEQRPDFVGPPQDRSDYMIRALAGNEQTAPMALEFQMKRAMKQADSDADLRLAQEKKRLGLDRGSVDPYWTTLSTTDGMFRFNARSGEIQPLTAAGGKPLVAPVASPDLAGAKAAAAAQGKAQGEAAADLPGAELNAQYAKEVIDQLIAHPGRPSMTGLSGAFGISTMRGLPGAGAKALHDQVTGQAFLEAFQSLKGGGHITEIEGEKATQARARLSTAQSDKEYLAALKELQGLLDLGLQRARQKAGKAPALITNPDAEAGVIDFNSLGN